ncbi:hypothetical protein C8R43DRAFT_1019081 [Mycena crocata]|nr:hypothetical protein C8R43DRAFT_1019081 [Mycena crocata]
MSLPWTTTVAQAARNKAAVSEGLRIVRKVIARDAVGKGLSTAELYKRSIREPPPPSYARTLEENPLHIPNELVLGKYLKSGRRRLPPSLPPHPRHPIRSVSFLKHRLLPMIAGERLVQHVSEKRIMHQPTLDAKSRSRASKQEATSSTSAAPVETTVWLWQAARPPVPAVNPAVKSRPPRPPIVYDFSHMKPSKRKAHRARQELAEKYALLRSRREAIKAEARKKEEIELRAARKAQNKIIHDAAEKIGLAEKERRRKVYEEKMAKAARKLQKKLEKEQSKKPISPPKQAQAA